MHVQKVVIELHLASRYYGKRAQRDDQSDGRGGAAQPEILDARAAIDLLRGFGFEHVAHFDIEDILFAAENHGRKHGHHRDEAHEHAATADNAHLLDAAKVRERHGEKRAGGRGGAREYTHAGVQVNAKINCKANQDRRKGNREDVQVAHGGGGISHGVRETHEQACGGF